MQIIISELYKLEVQWFGSSALSLTGLKSRYQQGYARSGVSKEESTPGFTHVLGLLALLG